MTRRTLIPAALALVALSAAFTAPAIAKWPPWLSIESPVNPFDPTARGAAFLVHAMMCEGSPQLADISGTAEGIVNGLRRSIPLRFDETGRPGVFAVRRQWPTEGTWLVRVALRSTTAIVTLDQHGNVASARVPTAISSGSELPRSVAAHEIDSTLAAVARR